MNYQWIKKRADELLQLSVKNGIPYFFFPLLEETGLVRHGFSSRLGGVSKGDFAEMNFSFSRGDNKADVLENYQRMADLFEQDIEKMVVSYQTHTVNVRKVTIEDAGKGVIKERDYQDVDGLITNEPDLMLVTFYADCVPLFFVDPVKKAIGLSHSGWRGTVGRMGQVTIERMTKEYGTDPADLLVAIGPCICKDCYEIGAEVAEQFKAAFKPSQWNQILQEKPDQKYQLDLWKANQIIFAEAGVKKEHIAVTNTCTCCNPELLFSHRKTGEKRGNLAAFLSLKQLS